MKLYIRYFNNEVLVGTLDEALEFLGDVAGIQLDEAQTQEVADYVFGKAASPKRFKVDQRTYFIMIKTSASSLGEFKANNAMSRARQPVPDSAEHVDGLLRSFSAERPGWYQAAISFKRVIPSDGDTGKFQYADTEFEVRLKARSVQECYDRIVNYLRTRGDVDERSQFPSIKGRNFRAEFLGMRS